MSLYLNFTTRYVLLLKRLPCFILLLINLQLLSQCQNHWICLNGGNGFGFMDSIDMAYDINFNFEPPSISTIKGKKELTASMKNFTFSDNNGNLNLYTDQLNGFFDNENKLLNEKILFLGQGQNFVLMFPTLIDTLKLIVFVEDSLVQKIPSHGNGEIIVNNFCYNTFEKKITSAISIIDFKTSKYNPFKWQAGDFNTNTSFQIFKQFIDEKTGNYYLFFNIADTVFTSRYNPADMSFSKPYFSGMVFENNVLRNGSGAVQIPFGEDFIINNKGDKAIIINFGIRDNFPELMNSDSKAIISMEFEKSTGLFKNERLMEVLNAKSYLFRKCLSSNDSIFYFSYVDLSNSKRVYKYLLDDNYNIKDKYLMPLPVNEFSLITDIAMAPNGKIFISTQNNTTSKIDSLLYIIESPNNSSEYIKFSHVSLYKGLNVLSEYVKLFLFPNTYGSHKRADFTYRNNCKKNSVVLTNHSDTFWFKRFSYYMGNGDSVNIGANQINFVYHYGKPGKYWVKLKAFTKAGGWVWYSDTIVVQTAPNAYFSNQTTKGCQYIAFGFKDSSMVYQIKKDSAVRHSWHFGDGSSNYWRTYGLDIKQNQSHTYFNNGIYTVSHTVSDGYCTDTFSRINEVNILPAPKPGMVATPLTGCVPLNIALSAKYTDIVDSSHWQSTTGHHQSTKNQIGANFTFTQEGSFKVFHTQYSPTGCITKDTVSITALKGVDTLLRPELIAATVLDNNQIVVNWLKVTNARSYNMFKYNTPISQSITDTFFVDQTNANIKSYTYKLKATDVCNNSTQYSDIGKTILLTANNDKDNIGILRWNPYIHWVNGVKQYNILNIENNGNYILQQTADSAYKDQDFLIKGKLEKCYRILAIENNGNNAESQSNTVCVPYESVIWIPSTISINGDGLNESLKISTFGIQSYTISIYNRWGELVYQTTDLGDEWQPTTQQQGVYMYVVKAITNYGEYLTIGTITVLQ